MTELDDSSQDLSRELRWLRQAIGDLAEIITGKLDLRGPTVLEMKEAPNTREAEYSYSRTYGDLTRSA